MLSAVMAKAKKLPRSIPEGYRARRLSKGIELPGGYKRIYQYHVRKAAGTSIDHMFMSLSGKDGVDVYTKLTQSPTLRIIEDGKVFVVWSKRLIEEGNYFYASSHLPKHQIALPERTFTITSLRDPVSRVISHYKMLLHFKTNNIPHACMENEGPWLGESFDDFLDNIPPEHLLNQLYMFSESFDPDEAYDAVTRCSHFLFVDDFGRGIEQLSKKLDLDLKPRHTRKSQSEINIDSRALEKLKMKLEPEIIWYESLRKRAPN